MSVTLNRVISGFSPIICRLEMATAFCDLGTGRSALASAKRIILLQIDIYSSNTNHIYLFYDLLSIFLQWINWYDRNRLSLSVDHSNWRTQGERPTMCRAPELLSEGLYEWQPSLVRTVLLEKSFNHDSTETGHLKDSNLYREGANGELSPRQRSNLKRCRWLISWTYSNFWK